MKSLAIAIALLAAPQSAIAAVDVATDKPVFAALPLDDAMLGEVTGRAGIVPLSAGGLRSIVDDTGRSDLRQTGSVGRIQMDVWWGTIGSEAIAQNVRAAALR